MINIWHGKMFNIWHGKKIKIDVVDIVFICQLISF